MRVRDLLSLGRGLALQWTGVNAHMRRRLDGTRAAILMYHRVITEQHAREASVETGMYVTPATFGRHLDWLQQEFSVLPLYELVEGLAGGRALPPGACAITFDDGWQDNAERAFPELFRRGLPATVFVVTDRIGTDGAFWPDEVCRRLDLLSVPEQRPLVKRLGVESGGSPREALLDHLKALPAEALEEALGTLRGATAAPAAHGRELMDWKELDLWATRGVDVESHTASHAILTGVSEEAAREELREALQRLQERGHGRRGIFAYPCGAVNDKVARWAREAGYRAAVTVERKLAVTSDDPMRIPRLGVHECITRTRAEFLTKVPGRT